MPTHNLNFAPISVSGETQVKVGIQPYERDRLQELRVEFRETHVFRRDGEQIVDIPIAAGIAPLGNLTQKIDLAKETKYWQPLLTERLVQTFAGARDIYSDRPVTIIGAPARGMIRHSKLPEWVQRRTCLQFEVRTLFVGANQRMTGLVCDTRIRNFILGSTADLLEAGVDLLGRWVQVEQPPYDPRFMTRRKLVGRVARVRGDVLELEDHEEGYATIGTEEAFLEARAEALDDCVMQILSRDAGSVLAKADREAHQLNSGPGKKAAIEDALHYLRDKVQLHAVPGVKFTVGSLLAEGERGFPTTEAIPQPIMVFDPSGTRKNSWKERGLQDHGPYDQRTFTPKKLRIAVVCQAKHEGGVDAFIAKFLDGMPDVLSGAKKVARYGDGFLRRFRLDRPSVTFFTAAGPSAADYVSASRSALKQSSDEGFKWDLAFVQIEESFKQLPPDVNPYYATKAQFLKLDVPVQSVRLETMSQPGGELVFSMNHMSLATYAKLGGTPWLLASQQRVAHELVIGLGSHSVTSSRLGARQRFVGITTVFSSDGSYLLSDRTAVVPYEEYADALYETLKTSIKKVRTDDNWRSTDKVRLVFHVFKPLKDAEAEAVKRAVEDQGLDDVTFAFVHVAQDHPYLIFDNEQGGVGYGNPKKGMLGPARGLHLKLSDFESLVVFSGSTELKQASDGMPRPCLLKLHRLSTFTDMTYLARQAYEFAGHSWRMLSPEPFPITIRYSDLIAERLSGLNAVPGWDADAVQFGAIGKTLWFL